MVTKIKLDEDYTLEMDAHNFVLKLERALGEINPKTGKEMHTKVNWYYPQLKSCLTTYLNESLKKSESLDEILAEIHRVEEIINQLKFKNEKIK